MPYSSPARFLSDNELLNYSKEHLRYEIWMFLSSGSELSRIRFSESDSTAIFYKNALVESFANHLRNLLLFLYPYSAKDDDVISDYFFVDPIADWKRKRPTESATLRNARERASREISHLTVLRRDGNDESKVWQVTELMEEIRTVLKVFVENASSTKLDRSVLDVLSTPLNTPSESIVIYFPPMPASLTLAGEGLPNATNAPTAVSSGGSYPR